MRDGRYIITHVDMSRWLRLKRRNILGAWLMMESGFIDGGKLERWKDDG